MPVTASSRDTLVAMTVFHRHATKFGSPSGIVNATKRYGYSFDRLGGRAVVGWFEKVNTGHRESGLCRQEHVLAGRRAQRIVNSRVQKPRRSLGICHRARWVETQAARFGCTLNRLRANLLVTEHALLWRIAVAPPDPTDVVHKASSVHRQTRHRPLANRRVHLLSGYGSRDDTNVALRRTNGRATCEGTVAFVVHPKPTTVTDLHSFVRDGNKTEREHVLCSLATASRNSEGSTRLFHPLHRMVLYLVWCKRGAKRNSTCACCNTLKLRRHNGQRHTTHPR